MKSEGQRVSRELRLELGGLRELVGFKGQGGDRREGRRWGVWDRLSLEGNQSSRGYGQAPEVGGRDARAWAHSCKHSLRAILFDSNIISSVCDSKSSPASNSFLMSQSPIANVFWFLRCTHPPIPHFSAPLRPCGSNFLGWRVGGDIEGHKRGSEMDDTALGIMGYM